MFASFTALAASVQQPQRLLEITTRPYLYGLSKKLGRQITKFRDIPDSEFLSWKEKGFEWVWFMGIWQLGPAGVEHDLNDQGLIQSFNKVLPGWTKEDVIGSPYAIVSYTVNTELGSEADLDWLRNKLHSLGMKLMVDFVPNHSATDAPEVTSKLNYYIRCPQGQTIDRSKYLANGIAYGCGIWCDPWTDVAQFNYCDEEFRKHQIEVLKYIAKHADGVRCDMAHLIINDEFYSYWETQLRAYGYNKPSKEFWAEAISAVKASYPDFIFMAESYGDVLYKLHSFGFDYTYDKDCLDKLYYHDVKGFQQLLWNSDINYKQHLAHFTENHDEPRTMEKFWNWAPAADCAAASLLTLPGLRFFNQDQWLGYKNKIDVHLRRAADDAENEDVKAFYDKLFALLKTDALRLGTFTQLNVDGSDTIPAWRYAYGNERYLIMANFNENQSGGRVVLDDCPLGQTTFTDFITGDVYTRDGSEVRSSGLSVVLGHYQVQIFKY